jgi:hypothetical protein
MIRPRGFIATFLRLLITLGGGFAVLFSLGMAVALRERFVDFFWPGGTIAGAMFGFVSAAYGAPKARAITRTVSLGAGKETFTARLTLLLAEWSYFPRSSVGSTITFARWSLLGDRADCITVVVNDAEATVLGPAESVARVERAFRSPAG